MAIRVSLLHWRRGFNSFCEILDVLEVICAEGPSILRSIERFYRGWKAEGFSAEITCKRRCHAGCSTHTETAIWVKSQGWREVGWAVSQRHHRGGVTQPNWVGVAVGCCPEDRRWRSDLRGHAQGEFSNREGKTPHPYNWGSLVWP